MKVFFGKISDKVETKQLTDGYYRANKDSSWFNGINIGDYCFMIGGKKIQLWKAQQWGERNGDDVLEFDILIHDLGINTAELTSFIYFKLSMHLIIFPVRSAGKSGKAFFPITVDNKLTDVILKDLSTYKDKRNFRKIQILSTKEKTNNNSGNIQLYLENQVWKIIKPIFSEENPFENFVDNTQYIGSGQPNKDKALRYVVDKANWDKPIDAFQLSVLNIYDAFCCNYKQTDDDEEAETLKSNFWVVGATWGGDDKSEEFIKSGEWINGYESTSGDKSIEKVKTVQVGDWIAIKTIWSSLGIKIKAVGKVTSNSLDGRHLKVEWLFKGPSFELKNIFKLRTIHEITDEKEIQLIFKNNYKSSEMTADGSKDIVMSKNTILFGPPGTGKTYNSINKAISIINPSFDLEQERDAVKAEYDRLVDVGQIVFTTFHQSMSYEDFIEGIKPIEPIKEGDAINYKVLPGIFKRLCDEASFYSLKKEEIEMTKEELEFSDCYDSFVESLKETLSSGKNPELESRSGGSVIVDKISDQNNILVKHHDGKLSYPISKYRLTKLDSAFKDLNEVSNIDRQFREVIGGSNSSANWSVLNAIRKSHTNKKQAPKKELLSVSDKKFVIIIDEINRGNVSQIFGELITLVEDNKRLGLPEALKIVLPYSKQPFGVPSNVHIIGTMNTADRSVEALDTALRRRFVFEEMPPCLEVLEKKLKFKEIDLVEILKTINQRLVRLLNKDHLIGHSFFLKVKDLNDLKITFANEIVPLLQEYFYGDFGKIGLVLGAGFVENISKVETVKFAKFDGYDSDDLEARAIYKVKDLSKLKDAEFKQVVLSIIG